MADLHEDILWKIFMMNTDFEAPEDDDEKWDPITIARCTSQVCQSWRSLLLRFPSIWGRIIHLDCLAQESVHWKRELLRRTGDAPLYITGAFSSYEGEKFFFRILRTEWRRIRRIDVKINKPWHDEAWELLLRPNPTLDSFRLNCPLFKPPILSGSEDKLFGNFAPSLRQFSFPSFRFDFNASWFAGIQHLTITLQYTLPEILLAMRGMECLMYIRIEDGFKVDKRSRQNTAIASLQISLPQLLHINLRGQPSACRQFLGRIIPAHGCGLRLVLCDLINSKKELVKFRKVFNRFVHNHLAARSPRHFFLTIQSHFFALTDLEPASLLAIFDIEFHYDSILLSFVEHLFLGTLMEPPFATSQKLLKLAEPDFEEAYHFNFSGFTKSLSSLNTLQIDSIRTLDLIRQVSCTHTIPFPALNTVQIVDCAMVNTVSIQEFITWRTNCGRPISLLDFTSCKNKLDADLGVLEVFEGLEVIWSGPSSTEIYTCGTGHPERLNFGLSCRCELK